MPNFNGPFGFRQFSGTGASPTYEQSVASVNYNATAIYYGDPVTALADGSVAQSVSTGATPGLLGIAGIFVGCKYLSVSQKRTVWSNYWPGTDVASGNSVEAYIINDPAARFIAQTDATGLALADVNATIGFVIGSGNTANGISGAYLDTTTLNLSSASPNFYMQNSPFKVVGILQQPPTAPGTLGLGQPYDWAVVAFNSVFTRNFLGV